MINHFVDKIVDSQVRSGVLEQPQVNIYKYGYCVMIEMLFNIIAGIVLGVLFQRVDSVLIFWIIFIPLRSYCGGWHAENAFICFLMSAMALLMVLFMAEGDWKPKLWLELVNLCLILGLSPVDTKEKPISPKEKKYYKKIVVVLLGIQSLLWFWLTSFREYIYFTHIIVCVSLLCQKLKNWRRNCAT